MMNTAEMIEIVRDLAEHDMDIHVKNRGPDFWEVTWNGDVYTGEEDEEWGDEE